MFIEGNPEDDDFGPDHYDMDPSDCPNFDEEPEPSDEPLDGDWLISVVTSLDTVFSIAEIESVLREPKKILKGIDRKTIDRLEELAWENLLGYPSTCHTLRDDILDCAADDARSVPWIQVLALLHAVDSFHNFRHIGCYSEDQLAQFVVAFANANWWVARWQDLVKEYGDRTLDFLI
jgi:hypothetical protein